MFRVYIQYYQHNDVWIQHGLHIITLCEQDLSLSLRERLVAPCRPIADGSTHGRSTDAMTRLSDAMTVQLLP